MKKLSFVLLLCAALLLSACGTAAPGSAGTAPAASGEQKAAISFENGAAKVRGGGAKADGVVVTIASAGTYTVSGTSENGQIIVDTGEEALNVRLVLDNLTLSNPADAVILVRQAKNVYLSVPAGSRSVLTSGTEADLERFDGTQNGAVIFSEDDLILEGEGELEAYGYINNGVTCKDDLLITGGTLTVSAASNGLRGAESVTVEGGTITITAGNDGVKSTSSTKAGKGYVTLSGGSLTVRSGGDGVSAETVLTVSGGTLDIVAEGDGLEQSSKALKATDGIVISGGTLTLRAVEDAIHCDVGDVTVSNGAVTVVTEGDGIQAGEKGSGLGTITVTGGTVAVSAAKQALHARGSLVLDGGTVLFCAGSAKQEEPEGALPHLFERVPGAAGDRLSLDGRDLGLEASGSFLAALYADGSLVRGQSYTFAFGPRSVYAAAK